MGDTFTYYFYTVIKLCNLIVFKFIVIGNCYFILTSPKKFIAPGSYINQLHILSACAAAKNPSRFATAKKQAHSGFVFLCTSNPVQK
jgi:hypothetical protein